MKNYLKIPRNKRHCSVKNCKGKYFAVGFCGMHYQRNLRWGDPGIVWDALPPKSGYNIYRFQE